MQTAKAQLPTYQRRTPENTLLYKIIERESSPFFANQEQAGIKYPGFIYNTVKSFLGCGILDKGFIRLHCETCKQTTVLGFSCKKRGFCPSCHAKRMHESAYHLSEFVLPKIPYRQWVLSIPFVLRPLIANRPKLITLFGNIFVRAVSRWLRRQAKICGVKQPKPGAVLFIQRFGGGLQLNPHYHVLFTDGVYFQTEKSGSEKVYFHQNLRDPDADELKSILERIVRVVKPLHAKGTFDLSSEEENSTSIAESLQSRDTGKSQAATTLMGELVVLPKTPYKEITSSKAVALDGFNLNASVSIKPHQRDKLKRLIRYVARGPIAEARLSETRNGSIVYEMKKAWHNGADRVVFTPEAFMKRIIALIPPTKSHIIRYNGVFGSNSRLRDLVIPASAYSDEIAKAGESEPGAEAEDSAPKQSQTVKMPLAKKLLWAEMMAMTFKIDVTKCQNCGGKRKPIAIIKDPVVAKAIMNSLGLPTRDDRTGEGAKRHAQGPPEIGGPEVMPTTSSHSPSEDIDATDHSFYLNHDQRPDGW